MTGKESLFHSRWRVLETAASDRPDLPLAKAMKLAASLVPGGVDTCLLCDWCGSPDDPHDCKACTCSSCRAGSSEGSGAVEPPAGPAAPKPRQYLREDEAARRAKALYAVRSLVRDAIAGDDTHHWSYDVFLRIRSELEGAL